MNFALLQTSDLKWLGVAIKDREPVLPVFISDGYCLIWNAVYDPLPIYHDVTLPKMGSNISTAKN